MNEILVESVAGVVRLSRRRADGSSISLVSLWQTMVSVSNPCGNRFLFSSRLMAARPSNLRALGLTAAGRMAKPHNVVKQQLAIKLRAGRQVNFSHCDSVLASTAGAPANPPKDVE